jgi:hypothetical protein
MRTEERSILLDTTPYHFDNDASGKLMKRT